MLAVNLPRAGFPSLDTAEALRDLTSETTIFTAMYLYRHCKPVAAVSSNPPSNVHDDTQPVRQEPDQTIQKTLEMATRILQKAGYNPQPENRDESLDGFRLERSGSLAAESNGERHLAHQQGSQVPESTHHVDSEVASETENTTKLAGPSPGDAHKDVTQVIAVTPTTKSQTRERPLKRLRASDD